MLLVVAVLGVVGFPAGAMWAWRRNAGRGLAGFVVTAAVVTLLLALFVASEAGGNRLVQTRGYQYTASGSVLLAIHVLILPLVAAATSVWVTRRRGAGTVYLLALASAIAAATAGGLVATYMVWR